MEQFSIIIPTMWKSQLLFTMLQRYQNNQHVAEVIIIDNDSRNFDSSSLEMLCDKVTVFTQRSNIFVNPAWNLGASMAKHTIVLANDDINIRNLDLMLEYVMLNPQMDLIGATVNNLSPLRGIQQYDKANGFPRKSFGYFMVCRAFLPIPEGIKILCGDNWLFHHANRVGMIGAWFIETPISVTIKSDPEFTEIGLTDKQTYKRLIKNI
jgi:hypothetical protein